MADISQIKLPNNTVLNLKDLLAVGDLSFSGHTLTATKRNSGEDEIDLSTFDTLTATEFQTGNMVATGAARFTNVIYGNLTGDVTGNADTATKLAATKTILTNLASSTAANFDGSANVTPGVTGTLGVGNGGTGQTTGANAANYFLNSLDIGTSTPVDADYYISQYVNGGTTTTTYHRRPMSALWTYISGRISSILGLTASQYGGNAATATTATNANHATSADTATSATSATNATTANALNVNSAVGSATVPVFFNANGVPQTANTIPKLNNGTSGGTFYAPTSVGSSSQYLKSNGSGAPSWETFSKSTVGLGNVDNTADANKSVLYATSAGSATTASALSVSGAIGSSTIPVYFDANGAPQTANTIPKLNNTTTGGTFYAPTSPGSASQFLMSSGSGAPSWETLSKSSVGLGNVDNTSDANKPISTATQAALDNKAAKQNGIYIVKGTHTTATSAWTGNLDLPALYDGLTITYQIPKIGTAGATLNLTLEDGTTTTGPIKVFRNVTQVATAWVAGSTVILTYWSAGSISIDGTASTEAGWYASDYSVTNHNTIGEYAGACIAGPGGMARYSLILQVSENRWESLVTSSSTGTSKTMNSHGFLLSSPILYQNGGTYAENASAAYSACWSIYNGLDTRYSFNCSKSWSAKGKPLYLVGTISNGKFYLKSTTWWADALPSTADGYYYWYVGQMQDAYLYTLHPTHPIFYYKDGQIVQYTTITKADIGLGNVDNTADANKSVNYATTAGSAGSATTAQTAQALSVNDAIGSATVPVYINASGVPQTANTIPKLNNTTTGGTFYAPISAGTSDYYLKSTGNAAPVWAELNKTAVGLGNVDNTADANKNVLYATSAGSATTATTADKATKANITTTTNAIAYYTDTAGTFGSKASANGALYATSANGALTFGTLPVAQGGTGNTNGTASYATTTADTSNTLYLIGVTSTDTTELKRDTSITIKGGTITATTFSGALSGNATTATTATNVSTGDSAASFNASTHVWFSNNTTETQRSYDDDFKYNPSSNTLTVGTVVGALTGNATSATSATQDESGNNIKATYAAAISISDHTITLKNKNDASLGTVTVPDNNTIPSAYCDTSAATAAKTAVCTDYVLRQHNYIHVIIKNSNTKNTALTLAINGTTAKTIKINDAVSSSSNYTLPAGSYIVYYDGTNYCFRTDGRIPGFIQSAYNLYTSSYTDSSALYLTGVTSSDTSYQRVYHSPYITMKPYELLVQDRSTSNGISIGAITTTSATENSVTTYTDGGLITINRNVHTSSVATVTTTASILLNGSNGTIGINAPGTSTQTILLEGSTGMITSESLTVSSGLVFTQAEVDAMYPTTASSSIDIPTTLVATVNQRLNTQDGVIGAAYSAVSALGDIIGTVPSNTTVQGQINTINTSISTLNSRLTFSTLGSSNYQATSTNYEYVNLSLTVPSGKWALVRFEAWWSTGAPYGIEITNSSATPGGANLVFHQEVSSGSNTSRSTPALLLSGGYTYYMWVKRGSVPTGTNGHAIYGAIL